MLNKYKVSIHFYESYGVQGNLVLTFWRTLPSTYYYPSRGPSNLFVQLESHIGILYAKSWNFKLKPPKLGFSPRMHFTKQGINDSCQFVSIQRVFNRGFFRMLSVPMETIMLYNLPPILWRSIIWWCYCFKQHTCDKSFLWLTHACQNSLL